MKANINKEVTVVLTLSAEEAYWLKCVMDNPLRDDEEAHDKQFRDSLYYVLPHFDLLQKTEEAK